MFAGIVVSFSINQIVYLIIFALSERGPLSWNSLCVLGFPGKNFQQEKIICAKIAHIPWKCIP